MKGTIEDAGGDKATSGEDVQASPYEINAIRTLSVTKGLDPAQPFILSLCQVTVDTMAFPWLSFFSWINEPFLKSDLSILAKSFVA
jgi:hypothetical protein